MLLAKQALQLKLLVRIGDPWMLDCLRHLSAIHGDLSHLVMMIFLTKVLDVARIRKSKAVAALILRF